YVASAPPGYVAAGQHGLGGAPNTPGAPHSPYTPNTPGVPQSPYTPNTPGVPQSPYTPNTPGVPQSPYTPNTPGAPHTPYAAQTPGAPHTPGASPAAPNTPHTPAGGPGAYDPWQQGQQPRGPYGGYNPYGGGAAGNAGFPTVTAGGPPPGGPRRRTPAAAIVGIVVAVLLVAGGGTWAAIHFSGDQDTGGSDTSKEREPQPGSEYPYGEQAALKKPLEVGDCVKAVWTGTAFDSVPDLGVVDCAEDWPDGQVVAVERASDHADAKAGGARRCAAQADTIAEALPDAGVYALVPSKEGFTTAKGGTACLVLGRHVPIGGEVGRLRDVGMNLWPTQMAVGDCWDYTTREDDEGYDAPLTDCAEAHTDQVVGSVQAPANMTFDGALAEGGKLCTNRFESSWAPGTELIVSGWVSDKDEWKKGFSKVVCTVRNADVSKTTGKIRTPGSV
ncbi:septum formation family protein, partial [Streptomyces scabiei]